MRKDPTYLGDGVYAHHDGYHIWLTTQRESGEAAIALEPPVLAALVKYEAELIAKYNEEKTGDTRGVEGV